jgi:DNA gyrase subunit A
MPALPDIGDGLTLLEREILRALRYRGSVPGGRFVSSARIVCTVTGVKSPRWLDGDLVAGREPDPDDHQLLTYLAIVRMTQPWVMRYPLLDARGNLGSVDGDPPADHVYTEIRMSRFSEAVFDLDSATARVPHLLVQGSPGPKGCDLGFPPHRLTEVCAAAQALLADPELPETALRSLVPGPDFPTGGLLVDPGAVYDAGRGEIRVRARGEPREGSIVVTELPFATPKADSIVELSELVLGRRIEGLVDVRDESDRDGIKVVLHLRRGADGAPILGRLFAQTSLERRLQAEMVAVEGGAERTFSLRQALLAHLEHRRATVAREHPGLGGPAVDERIAVEMREVADAFADARRTELPR